MTEKQAQQIQYALDSLGCALADHEHKWTSEERKLYYSATDLLNQVSTGLTPVR